jgi:glutaredoxin
LQAWSESLGDITYPLLSDFFPHGKVAQSYGVLRDDGRSERAIFIIDKQGIIRYIDIHDIDDQPDNEELFKVLHKLEPDAQPAASHTEGKEVPADAQDKHASTNADVVLYCTSWCPACRRARIYLKSNRIDFKEINITEDREAAARVREWAGGNETTPTIYVNGEVVVNFDRDRLDQIFGFQEKT